MPDKKESLMDAIKRVMAEAKKPLASQAAPYGGGTKKTMKSNQALADASKALDEEAGE